MAASTVLVVDDEAAIRRTLREILEYEDLHVEEARDGEEALRKVRRGSVDVVLLDIKMPKRDGLEVLSILCKERPELPVVMISGHADIKTAVEATHTGAFHFIEKPPDLNRLLVTIRSALSRGELVLENRRMRQSILERRHGELVPILGDSSPITQIKETISRVAPTEARVLITGEPGTGKELVAKWIHNMSPRRDGPLVEVNCAAIPADLIESELFGHEKGSFTGATKQRIGKFEQAHRGTLFLDEIGDMSLSAQAKVLRVLQESTITRVGGDRAIKVGVRVVAATNKNLLEAATSGKFREDLYHRLSVILIHVPPMRERIEDLPTIIRAFAKRLALRNGVPAKSFTQQAVMMLKSLPWRGNVREIHNVAERLLILSQGKKITALDVERYVVPSNLASDPFESLLGRYEDFNQFKEEAEKIFLLKKLREGDWNVTHTAEAIGMNRSQLSSKMSRYGIEREG